MGILCIVMPDRRFNLAFRMAGHVRHMFDCDDAHAIWRLCDKNAMLQGSGNVCTVAELSMLASWTSVVANQWYDSDQFSNLQGAVAFSGEPTQGYTPVVLTRDDRRTHIRVCERYVDIPSYMCKDFKTWASQKSGCIAATYCAV